MRHALALLLIALPAPAVADPREALYGTWGTAQQCARAPLGPGLSVPAEPFEIDEQWLRQGQFWCQLNWFPVERREDEVFTGAYAQCGEDAVRQYLLRMTLAEEALTLRWDFLIANGPLNRCPDP